MGMSAAAAKEGPVAEPNIVPLIDVLLVLIIIFMVITPRIPTGLPALIPQLQSKQDVPEPGTIFVRVMSNGRILINQEPSDWDALGPRLADIFKTRADKVAFVQGAEDVPFAEMARALDIMRGVGIDRVGLITSELRSAK
jgi:biopolymer transport protein TolR